MLPVCKNLQEAIDAIRAAPINALRSSTWLEHEFLPSLGLHESGTWPAHLRPFQAKGVQSWQWPNQFAPYLVYLSTKTINDYLEIGLSYGGTFIITCEYLRRFNPSLSALGVDIKLKPSVLEYQEMAPNIALIGASSQSDQVSRAISARMWGLSLVDGDHSEEGCWSDYQTVKDFTSLAAFHDITNDIFPGVGAVWARLTAAFPRSRASEFVQQYAETIRDFGRVDYGIGVMEIRD